MHGREANGSERSMTNDHATNATFSADQIATAFDVDPVRVARAMAGEFGLGSSDRIDSRMAHHLSEVILGDLPLDRREAALLNLGAFAPRRDMTEGVGNTPSNEESDRQSAVAGVPADETPSKRSSYDPATQDAR